MALETNIFRQLECERAFIETVGNYFRSTPSELGVILSCSIVIDEERLRYAFNEYEQDIKRFALFLQSGDPDHHKRAGSLLHALYVSKPIVSLDFKPKLDDVDTLFTPLGVTYGDAEGELSFGHFYQEYHNEFTAFSMAYDVWRQFVENPKEINFEYVHTVCVYLRNNGNLSVESLFILFKSLAA